MAKPFFLITGPPAVGKMSVGRALADACDFVLFHNHHSIEYALQFFEWGTPGFKTINEGLRQLMFDAALQLPELKGFIFTLVWAFDMQEDWDYVEDLKTRFSGDEWEFHIVELSATLEERLIRNDTPERLAAKPSKRDPEVRRSGLLGLEGKYQMNSLPGQLSGAHYLHIDNTKLTPEAVAKQIISHFQLHQQ